jgi:hypothetical protein
MLYLIWGILNLAVFVFFLRTCVNATKLVREKIGMLAAIVFVFGLFSFVAHTSNSNNEHNKNETGKWKFVSEDSIELNSTNFTRLLLEKSLMTNIDLGIQYGKDKHKNQCVPITAFSGTSGFVSGTTWKPLIITVNTTTKNNELQYYVSGVLKWQLLGTTFYSQEKFFKGIAVTQLDMR